MPADLIPAALANQALLPNANGDGCCMKCKMKKIKAPKPKCETCKGNFETLISPPIAASPLQAAIPMAALG